MKSVFSLFLLAVSINAHAQQDPHTTAGSVRIIEKNQNANLYHIPAGELVLLKSSLMKLELVAGAAPNLKAPEGYNITVDAWYEPANAMGVMDVPPQKALTGHMYFGAWEFYIDEATKKLKADDESSGSIKISINDLLAPSYFGPSNDMADAGHPIPIFFFGYQSRILKTTGEYTEIQGSQTLPYRVITNGKPVYVPLTKGQYLTYKIAFEKAHLQKLQEDLNDKTERRADIKKAYDGMLQKKEITKGGYDSLMQSDQEYLDAIKDLVAQSAKKLAAYQKQEREFTPTQKNAPAAIVWGGDAAADQMMELTSDDDPNKMELMTPNPDYFNPALPPSAVQLIIVTKSYNPGMVSPFMKDKLDAAFEQIDYAKLKTMIQK